MGYRAPRKTFRLVFEDEDRAGLEVRARSASVGRLLEIEEKDGAESVRMLFEAFADALEGWNLEDEDGNPVPATLAGLMSLDLDFATDLVAAWKEGITGISGPLERKSNGGAPSPDGAPAELSIPMEPSSASPWASLGQN